MLKRGRKGGEEFQSVDGAFPTWKRRGVWIFVLSSIKFTNHQDYSVLQLQTAISPLSHSSMWRDSICDSGYKNYFLECHTFNYLFIIQIFDSQRCFLQIKTNRTESNQRGMTRDSVTLMSPEAGPISILRNTLLALQLLPSNASAGMLIALVSKIQCVESFFCNEVNVFHIPFPLDKG